MVKKRISQEEYNKKNKNVCILRIIKFKKSAFLMSKGVKTNIYYVVYAFIIWAISSNLFLHMFVFSIYGTYFLFPSSLIILL